MRTSASARLAKMPPAATPVTSCCRSSCTSNNPRLVTEVRAPDRLVALQLRAVAMHRNPADFEHVCGARKVEGDPRVLFDQQHSDAACLVDRSDDLEDGSNDDRSEPERRFV